MRAGLSLSSVSVVDTCSQAEALVTWVIHPAVASCGACGWWHPSEPCPPCTVLVLVVLWHLFLQNFTVFEFSPLSSLSRTLSSRMLSYSFQRAATGRCSHAFLCHYLGSGLKISHRIILGASPLSSLTSIHILGSFDITDSLNCSVMQAMYFFHLHDNISGNLSECEYLFYIRLQMSNIKCLF